MAFSCGACVSNVVEAVLPRRAEGSKLLFLRGQVQLVQRIYGQIEKQDLNLTELSVHRRAATLRNNTYLEAQFRVNVKKLHELYQASDHVDGVQPQELRALQAVRQVAKGLLEKRGEKEAGFAQKQRFLMHVETLPKQKQDVERAFESVEKGLATETNDFNEEQKMLEEAGRALMMGDELRQTIRGISQAVELPNDAQFNSLSLRWEARWEVVTGLEKSSRAKDLFARRKTILQDFQTVHDAFIELKNLGERAGCVSTLKNVQERLISVQKNYDKIKEDVQYFSSMQGSFDADILELSTTLSEVQGKLQGEGAWEAELDAQRKELETQIANIDSRVGVEGRERTLKTMLTNYRSMKKEISQFPELRKSWKADKEKCKSALSELKGGCLAGTRLGLFFL